MSARVGQQLGNYQLIQFLETLAAVKVLHTGLMDSQAFRIEARYEHFALRDANGSNPDLLAQFGLLIGSVAQQQWPR